jgi:hypothetical protein
MFESTVRPLNDKEKRALRVRLASLRADWARLRWRLLVVVIGLCTAMTAVTTMAGNVSWTVAFMCWLATSLLIGVWIWIEEFVRHRRRLRRIESALRGGSVRDVRVQASAVAEFEEEEDEGACYAFKVGAETILFISGQEFYSSRTFPNTDFSLIEIHDTEGELVEFYIEKHGHRLEVSKTISADGKKRLRVPDHLARVEAPLSDLERVLASNET